MCHATPLLLVAAGLLTFCPSPGRAQTLSAHRLRADELLLVYNRDDPRSRELAEYYAKVRAVPPEQLCPVRAPRDQEEISRTDFDRYIRRPVRAWFAANDADGTRVRCLVTFYGLPIRVGPKQGVLAEQKLGEQWRREQEQAIEQLAGVLTKLDGRNPASQPAKDQSERLVGMIRRYQVAMTALGQKLREPGTDVNTVQAALLGTMQQVEGLSAVLSRTSSPDAASREQLEALRQMVRAADPRIVELRRKPLTDPLRKQARDLIRQNYGLVGLLASLDTDIASTRAEESEAALDSELMLVRWDSHPLFRWVPSTISWQVRADPVWRVFVPAEFREQPVMMAARIDGPTAASARRLIDDAMKAEKAGLSGTVYLDARGLTKSDGHGVYDVNLRELAGLLRAKTPLELRFDDRPELFGPGQCPNTMLYCGWYSLRNYIRSFTFVPGAVAYHIASFEAVSLKRPGERGWARGLLTDGAAATIAPVAEPYLRAFPEPKAFFGLLLSGRFSLAECYAYTTQLNSWMMMLIGDPLYCPFAERPVLKLEDVFSVAHEIPPEFRPGAATAIATTTAPTP